MNGGSDVPELVRAAASGDRGAWEAIVLRYTPLLMSVLRGYRLPEDDLRDIAQTVWLRLVEHLDTLREPRALPGWLITTTRNETIRTLKVQAKTRPVAVIFDADGPDSDSGSLDEDLLRIERREALLEAFAELTDRDRELLILLTADPPVPYADIGRKLSIPVGSIGPTRARALAKLRACPSLVALGSTARINAERR
jgi:RNA polymerase sigma factor (sigma-70 family)